MELSELTKLIAKRKRAKIKLDLRPNYKLYYNKYPHAIRVQVAHDVDDPYFDLTSNAQCALFKKALADKLNKDEYQVRHEWYCYSIFCLDVEKTLTAIAPSFKNTVKSIQFECMEDDIVETTNVDLALPRATTIVVKQLPFGTYRYKVYWPSTANKMAEIGKHSLEAITDQINNFPGCKPIKPKLVNQIHKMGYQWHGRYFYTTTEDIFSIISLIDQRFITRIEKFVTLEEVNAEKTSGSTN